MINVIVWMDAPVSAGEEFYSSVRERFMDKLSSRCCIMLNPPTPPLNWSVWPAREKVYVTHKQSHVLRQLQHFVLLITYSKIYI